MIDNLSKLRILFEIHISYAFDGAVFASIYNYEAPMNINKANAPLLVA